MISHLPHLMQCLLNDPLRLSDELFISVPVFGIVLRTTGFAAVEKIISHSPYGHK